MSHRNLLTYEEIEEILKQAFGEHFDRFVTSPNVYVIGHNRIIKEQLDLWIKEHGLNELNSEWPITKLRKNIEQHEFNNIDYLIEFAGRFCYKSWKKGRHTADYIENILKSKHGSVLEHAVVSFAIDGISRACSHELVRHRAGWAISQESQRFVDHKDVRFVVPPAILMFVYNENVTSAEKYYLLTTFADSCLRSLEIYRDLQEKISQKYDGLLEYYEKYKQDENMDKEFREMLNQQLAELHKKRRKRVNEAARYVLPNACETSMVWTGNIRAIRHMLEVRGSTDADLEIRRLAHKMFCTMAFMGLYSLNDISVENKENWFTHIPSLKAKYSKV